MLLPAIEREFTAEDESRKRGKGAEGTLGTGDSSLRPRLVEALLRHPISELACRGAHVLALTAKGQLWAWGRNEDGQLGAAQATAPRRQSE